METDNNTFQHELRLSQSGLSAPLINQLHEDKKAIDFSAEMDAT